MDKKDIWEFYQEVLSELDVDVGDDEENIFNEAFKSAFGYWPNEE